MSSKSAIKYSKSNSKSIIMHSAQSKPHKQPQKQKQPQPQSESDSESDVEINLNESDSENQSESQQQPIAVNENAESESEPEPDPESESDAAAAAADDDDDDDDDEPESDNNQTQTTPAPVPARSAPVKIRGMSVKALTEYKSAELQRGIIYLSRIPPGMKPAKLRSIMSEYGEVLRIYCEPEDPTRTAKRRKLTGNRSIHYTGGWIEFSDKRLAKRIALTLNNNIIGGKKRSLLHDDIWNIKYLSKFKWSDLIQSATYRNNIRENSIRNQLTEANKETIHYQQQVEKGQIQQKIQQRKQSRQNNNNNNNNNTGVSTDSTNITSNKRKFHQRELIQRQPATAESLKQK